MTGLAIPPAVRARAVSQGCGDWLAQLDDLVGRLCVAWDLRLLRVLHGGTTALVAEVAAGDRPEQTAVLKVSPPGLQFADQVGLLASAEGRGYVRLYRSDSGSEAALLERLGAPLASTTSTAVDAREQIARVCDLLPVAWRLPTTGEPEQHWDKADGLADLVGRLWPRYGSGFPDRVLDRALVCAERRAAAPRDDWLLVHGDPHPANTLRVLRSRPGAVGGYVFVDPDGFLADPSYDVGVLLRDWSADVIAADDPVAMMAELTRLAADRTGRDRDAVADWAFLERVSSGLFVSDLIGAEQGRPFLESATLLTP